MCTLFYILLTLNNGEWEEGRKWGANGKGGGGEKVRSKWKEGGEKREGREWNDIIEEMVGKGRHWEASCKKGKRMKAIKRVGCAAFLYSPHLIMGRRGKGNLKNRGE